MSHPNEPWSQQAIEDAAAAVRDWRESHSDYSRGRMRAELPTASMAAESLLAALYPGQWLAPEGVVLDEYLDAIRYELRGIARGGQ